MEETQTEGDVCYQFFMPFDLFVKCFTLHNFHQILYAFSSYILFNRK